MINTEIDWADGIRACISGVSYHLRHHLHFIETMGLTLLIMGVILGFIWGAVWLYKESVEGFCALIIGLILMGFIWCAVWFIEFGGDDNDGYSGRF
jgi:hypothetical protein